MGVRCFGGDERYLDFGWDGAAGAFAMVDTEHKLSLTYFQHCHKWNVPIQTQMRNALYECINE